jgi:hypothetical protein
MSRASTGSGSPRHPRLPPARPLTPLNRRWADELGAGGAPAKSGGGGGGSYVTPAAPAFAAAPAVSGGPAAAPGAAGQFMCACGMEAELRTSNSAANPGRQYYKCSKPNRVRARPRPGARPWWGLGLGE